MDRNLKPSTETSEENESEVAAQLRRRKEEEESIRLALRQL